MLGDTYEDWRNDADFIASARTDVPALVKALRRATNKLKDIANVSNTNRENEWAQEALNEVTAILNQGRKD